MGFCLICHTCTYDVIHDVITSIVYYVMRFSEVKNQLIVADLNKLEIKVVYMIHQLKRHLITLRFEYPTYAYDVNSDVNGKKTCAPNCSIRQTRNNSIVYDIPNRPDSSILHKACTYDAIRHHNINKHNAELRGTAPGANIPKSMFL
jgi:hypothetical protein